MPVRRRTRTRFVAPQRKLVWSRVLHSVQLGPTLGGTIQSLLGPLETDLGSRVIGATVMRVRGHILYNWGATTGLQSINAVGFGLRQVSSANDPGTFGSMTTAAQVTQQSPLGTVGRHQDWFGYDTAAAPANNWLEHFIDIKAHRKVDEVDQGMAFVIGGSQLIPAGTIEVTTRLSVLVALH